MKRKVLLALLIVISVFSFTSCSDQRDSLNSLDLVTDAFSEQDFYDISSLVSDDYDDDYDSDLGFYDNAEYDDYSDTTSAVVDNSNDDYNYIDYEGVSSSGEVWITESGKKYHAKSDCSNMKNPKSTTVAKAVSMGYEPCKRCYK